MRENERERQRHRQKKKQAPCREPNVGLNPRTPGSCQGCAKPLSHPGCLVRVFLNEINISIVMC